MNANKEIPTPECNILTHQFVLNQDTVEIHSTTLFHPTLGQKITTSTNLAAYNSTTTFFSLNTTLLLLDLSGKCLFPFE